jgi:hypothetical protein
MGIGPLALCENIPYPPIYQIFGTADEVFEVSHATEFDKKLKERGVESVAIVVPNMGHAFDVWAEVGGDVDEGIVRPAVGWVAGFAEVKQEVKGMI